MHHGRIDLGAEFRRIPTHQMNRVLSVDWLGREALLIKTEPQLTGIEQKRAVFQPLAVERDGSSHKQHERRSLIRLLQYGLQSIGVGLQDGVADSLLRRTQGETNQSQVAVIRDVEAIPQEHLHESLAKRFEVSLKKRLRCGRLADRVLETDVVSTRVCSEREHVELDERLPWRPKRERNDPLPRIGAVLRGNRGFGIRFPDLSGQHIGALLWANRRVVVNVDCGEARPIIERLPIGDELHQRHGVV